MNKLIIFGIVAIVIALGARTVVMSRRKPLADPAAKQRQLIQREAKQIAQLRHQISANPAEVRPHQDLAEIYARLGMQEQCAGEVEILARLQPQNETAQITLAQVYSSAKRYPDAVRAYAAILQVWPNSDRAWQGLSVTLYSMENYQRSLWAGKRALQLKPSDPHNQFGVAAATLQWAIQSNGMGIHSADIENAQKTLLNLLPQWRDKAGIHYLLGRAYAAQSNIDLAVQHLITANGIHPEQADIAYGLGNLYLKQQKRVEGRKIVETALSAQPEDGNLNEMMGRLWQESGEPGADEKALLYFQKAVAAKPDNPVFQERLGSALLHANSLDKAKMAYETSVRLDPNRSFPLQQLAVIYGRMGNKSRSAKVAEAAREVEFNAQQLKHLQSLVFTHPESANFHLALADRYRDLGMKPMARDEYETVVQIDSKNAHALNGLKALQGN